MRKAVASSIVFLGVCLQLTSCSGSSSTSVYSPPVEQKPVDQKPQELLSQQVHDLEVRLHSYVRGPAEVSCQQIASDAEFRRGRPEFIVRAIVQGTKDLAFNPKDAEAVGCRASAWLALAKYQDTPRKIRYDSYINCVRGLIDKSVCQTKAGNDAATWALSNQRTRLHTFPTNPQTFDQLQEYLEGRIYTASTADSLSCASVDVDSFKALKESATDTILSFEKAIAALRIESGKEPF